MDFCKVQDELMFDHEQIHEHIFRSMADGRLLSLLMSIPNAKTQLDEKAHAYVKLRDGLLKASERPHEIFATYLSIKMQRPEKEKALLSRYPKAHRSYYQLVSHCLDRQFGSTYLQHLVAFNMANTVFCSPFPSRFLEDPHPDSRPEPNEEPRHRFDALRAAMEDSHKVSKLLDLLMVGAKKIGRLFGFEKWDILSESDWASVSCSASIEMEYALSHLLREQLPQLSDIPYVEVSDPFNEKLKVFAQTLGFSVQNDQAGHNSLVF